MGIRSEPHDAQFAAMMNDAQEAYDKAAGFLEAAESDHGPENTATAMVWAQLATVQVLAAMARDMTEIRARLR